MTKNLAILHPGPIPLYHQLETDLRERINAGEFDPDAPLPTEERICAEYGVSRITVRRALDVLISEGLITKRRGVGTFLAEQKHGVRSVRLTGSLEEFLGSAGSLAPKLVSIAPMTPPPNVAAALGIGEGEKATRLELMNYIDGQPLGYLEIYLPRAYGESIRPEDVKKGTPIIRMVEAKAGQRVVRAQQLIEADTATGPVADHLGLEEGAPLLRVTRVYYSSSGAPIEVAVVRNHPERYKYTIDFSARPGAV